jgi:hypothetical protein
VIVKRQWNIPIWAGFAVVLAAIVSYVPVFVPFASLRDNPWPVYLLFAIGLGLIGIGAKRAFGQPEQYRGKISGSILGVLSLAIVGFFIVGTVYFTKQIPASPNAPQVGQQAPPFTLQDIHSKPVALADLLKGNRGALLIFYRGYW